MGQEDSVRQDWEEQDWEVPEGWEVREDLVQQAWEDWVEPEDIMLLPKLKNMVIMGWILISLFFEV